MMATTEKKTHEEVLETTGKTADDKLGEEEIESEEESDEEEEEEGDEETKEIEEGKDEVFNLPTPRQGSE